MRELSLIEDIVDLSLNRRSTIHGLPSELMRSVFSYFRLGQLGNANNDLRLLIRLTGVCRRWRAILHEMPLLWSEIDIDLPFHEPLFEVQKRLDRIERQLVLTGTVLLDVTWRMPSLDTVTTALALGLIAKSAPVTRWKSLAVTGDILFDEVDGLMLRRGGLGLESLENLKLSTSRVSDSLLELIDRTAFRLRKLEVNHPAALEKILALPLMRYRVPSLRITGGYLGFRLQGFTSLSRLEVPDEAQIIPQVLPSITHLTVEFILSETLGYLVASFANLEFLQLTFIDAFAKQLQVFNFPKLRCLIAQWDLGADSATVIGWIRAPQLEALHLHAPTIETELGLRMEMSLKRIFDPSLNLSGPRYRLTPSTLVLELPLSLEIIGYILLQSPDICDLTTMLEDTHALKEKGISRDEEVASMLVEIADGLSVVDGPTRATWKYCPRLTSLDIILRWTGSDRERWVRCGRRVIEERGSRGFHNMRVKWMDGEEIEIMA